MQIKKGILVPVFFAVLLMMSATAQSATLTGLDVMEKDGFAPLKGKNIGLITNHTGVNMSGESSADVLLRQSDFRLAAIFSPEHGFSGNATHGQKVDDSSYKDIPVYSLYGQNRRPTFAMLKNIDVLVFDIQDVGARFYTYLASMAYAMEEADKYGIPFFVLDRPNPAGGEVIEGPTLAPDIRRLTAYFAVPVRHGMTAGEIALMHAASAKLNLKPEVIRMEGWKRSFWFNRTGLPWISPSPNIRTPDAAILYSGIGCFEATNISVGRGTDAPFMWIGAPWLDAETLIEKLNAVKLAGIKFSQRDKTPDSDVYAGQNCKGIEFEITDRNKLRPFTVFVNITFLLRDMKQTEFSINWESMSTMTGNGMFETLYKNNSTAKTAVKKLSARLPNFRAERKKYLLY